MLKCFTHVVQVHLQRFRCNLVVKCVTQPEIAKKIHKKTYFRGSRSFKVIDVNKTKKPVSDACYGKQHVCTYLQLFSH